MYKAKLLFSKSEGLTLNILPKLEERGILRAETVYDLRMNIANVMTQLEGGMQCECVRVGEDCLAIICQGWTLAIYEYDKEGVR